MKIFHVMVDNRCGEVFKVEVPQSFKGDKNCFGFLEFSKEALSLIGKEYKRGSLNFSVVVEEYFLNFLTGDKEVVHVEYNISLSNKLITRLVKDVPMGVNAAPERTVMFGLENKKLLNDFLFQLAVGEDFFMSVTKEGRKGLKIGTWKTVIVNGVCFKDFSPSTYLYVKKLL